MKTYIDFELQNGESIKLTLNLKNLLKLKSKNVSIYNDVNRIITKGAAEIFDMVKIIYAAYLCAYDNNSDKEPMAYDTFIEEINQDIGVISSTVGKLISPKKNQDLENN